MLDLNSMSRTDLMGRIDVACTALSEIQELQGRRKNKERVLSELQSQLQEIYQYDAKVGCLFNILMFYLGFYVVVPGVGGLIDILTRQQWIVGLSIMPSWFGFIFIMARLRRKALNKKFRKKVEEDGTEERLQNEIREAKRQLAIVENEIREAHRKNTSVIAVFPPDYQSLSKLRGIYQILYNQRAMNWAGAASLYLQEGMQREKMQEEVRHNQQMEQAQQQYVKAQERQWEEQRRQNEEMMRQRQQIADEISGQLANIDMDINARR